MINPVPPIQVKTLIMFPYRGPLRRAACCPALCITIAGKPKHGTCKDDGVRNVADKSMGISGP